MYLKKLEIQGFKSFADKTALEFKPGVAIIVGPNGSGKSNIADAIRWVLGEQSVKSLRGGKMEDVIFAGSDKRRSLGMAEVSLTIDNSSGKFPLDFHEVTVTRRLYRSGESDYLINRVPCRLRDIHELFMDTGVGKEGISIIGQGRIDEILSVKPEERRGLIEEAAGIVKFRHRKRDAVKKLDDTENSLVRLNDIILELAEQEGPLAQQAEKTKCYQEFKTELDGLEIGLLIQEIEKTSVSLEQTKELRSKEQADFETLQTKYYQEQASEEENKLLLQKKEESVTTCQEEVYNNNLSLEKNESEKKLLQEKIASLHKQAENLEEEIQELQENWNKANIARENHQGIGSQLKSKLLQSREALTTYENVLKTEELKDLEMAELLEREKNQYFDVLQEQTEAKNNLINLQQTMALLTKQMQQINAKKEKIEQELSEVKERITALEQEAVQISTELEKKRNELLEAEHKLKEKISKYQQLQQHNRSLQEEKNRTTARLKIYQDMEQEGQGYGQGVKEVLHQKNKGILSGILGSVAQVLKVRKEHELAVEVVLGGSLQHIITTNEEEAQKSIQLLKSRNKGRATFLPLTTVKGRGVDTSLSGKPGVLGRLSELVQYEPKYQGIVEYLLGRVWLVEDLKTAVDRAKDTNFRFKIVTLDGQVVNAGGSLTGGSVNKRSDGILGRKRYIEELQVKANELEQKIVHSMKIENEEARRVEGLKGTIEDIKAELQELSITKAENSTNKERWSAEKARYHKELEAVHWQLTEIEQERAEAKKDKLEKEEKSLLLAQQVQDLDERIKLNQAKIKDKAEDKHKRNEKLTQLRIEVATIEEKVASYEKEAQYYQQQIAQLSLSREEKIKRRESLKEEKQDLERKQEELEKQQELLVIKLHEVEKKLEQLKIDKTNLQEGLQEISQNVKKYSVILKEKEEKLHKYELQQSKQETTLESSLKRLSEQYELELEQAKERGILIEERKQAVKRINELKTKVSALGPVNMSAIEEYARLKERLDFLTAQVQDLSDAKKRLEQVISEMDEIMTQRFNETFQLVSVNFQAMFSQLFGGGRAKMILTESECPLESGVEIIAQPPGKKNQYLSLLSGGERALTAIALLMAVLKIKPSPFCVLDEIESALDEANVYRFAQVLEEFSEETQFIVISHRKGTMEIGDVLYGVTIEESGVSRLVSVKLEDIKKEAS